MNIDAYDDQTRWEQNHPQDFTSRWQQASPNNPWIQHYIRASEGYIPGYDPDNDPMYHIEGKRHYMADLYLESENWWWNQGWQQRPAPSYRRVHGREKLGRMVDVYGAQAWLRWSKHEWRSKLWLIILVIGVSLGFGAAIGIFDLLLIPLIVLPVWLYFRHWYVKYYRVQQRVLDSGEPQWVPYERKRLRLIRRSPFYLWP
jgi:hypothetical protein